MRHATVGDVDAITALEAATQSRVPLITARSRQWWRWWVSQDEAGSQIIAARDGAVHGSAIVRQGPPGIGKTAECLSHVAADDADAVRALLAHARERGGGKPVGIDERAGIAHVIDGISNRYRLAYDLYVRLPDPIALLDHLRPVLSKRLSRSHYAGSSGSLLVSFYKHSLTMRFKDGEVTSIEPGGPDQNPSLRGGMSVPPDLAATLIFGRFGALQLEERYADVRLGSAADLAEVLFPQLASDIVTSV